MLKAIRSSRLFHLAVGLTLLLWFTSASAQTTRQRSNLTNIHPETKANEPKYTDYKGVRIGTTSDEVHKLLGQPAQKVDNQEFYIISEKETAQICYNAASAVMTISVDYLGQSSGAPDYKTVVGDNIEMRPDGSMWQLVRYEKAGFWVSYNRSSGESPTTTVTIQSLKLTP
jgi:hypothetical protein